MQENRITGCRPTEVGRCMTDTGCGEHGLGLHGYPTAMVYAPVQVFRSLYDPRTALCRGTLFGELDLPLEAAGRKRGGGCGCRPRGKEG